MEGIDIFLERITIVLLLVSIYSKHVLNYYSSNNFPTLLSPFPFPRWSPTCTCTSVLLCISYTVIYELKQQYTPTPPCQQKAQERRALQIPLWAFQSFNSFLKPCLMTFGGINFDSTFFIYIMFNRKCTTTKSQNQIILEYHLPRRGHLECGRLLLTLHFSFFLSSYSSSFSSEQLLLLPYLSFSHVIPFCVMFKLACIFLQSSSQTFQLCLHMLCYVSLHSVYA